jgi:glyoxylase-like metal-dependent hydrolase (beta-lactamase superfamily II)
MPKVKVLIQGYATTLKKGWIASSTTTLIQDGKINIIVDPGINRRKLLDALKREGLKPEDIDYILMTHYHPDHNYLSGIFPKAKALDDEVVHDEDREYEHGGKVPGTNLKILPTPGHEKFHGSLIVPTEKGTVVVAGDVWWWKTSHKQKTDRESLLSLKDMYVKDKKALLESRKKILKIADYIIPGHGKMFKSPK